MDTVHLSEVDDSKDTWSVVAKVLRKWVVKKKAAPHPIWKIGMILVDALGSTIEVSATHKFLIPKLLDTPKEGLVYNFQNFEVVGNDDKYRVTTTNWKFNFHPHTFIEESDAVFSEEGYNFKSIVDIRNGSIPDTGLIDVLGFLQVFGCLTEQRRESDNIKRLNLSIADNNENLINVTLWGDCAEETYAKKKEDMEPPIIVLVRFARLNRNTDYGHLSNAFNATLVTLNPNIPEALLLKERLTQDSGNTQMFSQISNADYPTYSAESLLTFHTRLVLSEISNLDKECDVVSKVTIQKCETLYGWFYDSCPCDKKPEYMPDGSLKCTRCNKDVLMTVPKYKVHYKVFDHTGKCSLIFFDRTATELLGKSASKIKEDMLKEGRHSTIPKELDAIAGKVVIVKLKIKNHNIKYRTSSIGVSQITSDTHLIQQFKYSNVEDQTTNIPEESSASRQTAQTSSQSFTVEDDNNTCTIQSGNLGIAEMCTPDFSSTKPTKIIKKEK